MAKIPYPTRLDPELLEIIKHQAKIRNRSINNMIEELLKYGILYLSETAIEPIPIIQGNKVETNTVN
jgi:hypothetical protein